MRSYDWKPGDLSHQMQGKLLEWAEQHPEVWETRNNVGTLPSLYQTSLKYLLATMGYHQDAELECFLVKVRERIQQEGKVLDLGCATGVVGTWFLLQGYPVAFQDYMGWGLKFLQEQPWESIVNWEVDVPEIIAYGHQVLDVDWVLALDVIEHAGDPLRFLHWIGKLGKNIALSYPIEIPFQPPYLPQRTDEWVDDEAVNWVVAKRYNLLESYKANGRRYIAYSN